MGHTGISVLARVAAANALAIAFYPLIRRRDALSIVTVTLACAGVMACLLIPPERVILRALTALVIVDLFSGWSVAPSLAPQNAAPSVNRDDRQPRTRMRFTAADSEVPRQHSHIHFKVSREFADHLPR